MTDHKVKSLGSIIPHSCGGIVNDKHIFRINELKVLGAHFILNADERIVHALAEGQVIDRAGHDDSYAEGFSRSGFPCRGVGSGGRFCCRGCTRAGAQ